MTAALVRQARPKQWVKNLLVFAAPGAAGVLDDWSSLWRAVVIFVAFCLASSGTYFWNDLLDAESDRNHPTKQHRPIASGAIPVGIGPDRRHGPARSPASAWRRPLAGRRRSSWPVTWC